MALEIGEVVKIREDLIAGNHYHGVLFVEDMCLYKGVITQIVNCNYLLSGMPFYKLKNCGEFHWTEDMFDEGDWFIKECPICHSNKMVSVCSHPYEKDKLVCYCQECEKGYEQNSSETVHEAKVKWNSFVQKEIDGKPKFEKGQKVFFYEDKTQQHLRSMTSIAEVLLFADEDGNYHNYYRLAGFADAIYPESLLKAYDCKNSFSVWLKGFTKLKEQEYETGCCSYEELTVCQDILKMFNTYFREKED